MLRIFQRQFSQKIPKDYKQTHLLGIIGVPLHGGQRKRGVELAPDYLRNAGLIDKLRNYVKLKDYGNITYECENLKCLNEIENMRNLPEVINCNKILYNKVKEILKENDRFLVLGGDHSLGIGSVGGHLDYNPDLAVIWVDAHADINLSSTTNSGNMHGMPVALILKELESQWKHNPTSGWFKNKLLSQNLVYIGLRDVEPKEHDLIRKCKIESYFMRDIQKLGLNRILEQIMDRLNSNGKREFHISFDIDSLDPNEAPSTGTAVNEGLTLEQGKQIIKFICTEGQVRGFDMVEVNPKIGTASESQKTINSAIKLILTAFKK